MSELRAAYHAVVLVSADGWRAGQQPEVGWKAVGEKPNPLGRAWGGNWGGGARRRPARVCRALSWSKHSGSFLRAMGQRTIRPWKFLVRSFPVFSRPGPLWAGTTDFLRIGR